MAISTRVARSWPKDQLTWRTRINLFLLHPWTCRVVGLVYAILLLPLWVYCIIDRLVCLALARRQGRKGLEHNLTPEVAAALNDPRWGKHMSVEANGLKFHAVAKGQHGKPLMLFLHGFPENWYTWRHQLEALGSTGEYYCVAVDMRGYGESDKPKGCSEYAITKIVADVAGIVKALGYDKVILVGHDWGANIAWHVALAHQSMISKLVVMDFPHPRLIFSTFSFTQFFRSTYIWLFHLPLLPELMFSASDFLSLYVTLRTRMLGLVNQDKVSATDMACFKYMLSKEGTVSAGINFYRNMFLDTEEWMEEALAKTLEVPTLVLWAEHDFFAGTDIIGGLDSRVSDLQLRHIKDASHWVQNDCPDVVNSAILDFLQPHKASPLDLSSLPTVSAAGLCCNPAPALARIHSVPILSRAHSQAPPLLSRSGSCKQVPRRMPRPQHMVLVQQ